MPSRRKDERTGPRISSLPVLRRSGPGLPGLRVPAVERTHGPLWHHGRKNPVTHLGWVLRDPTVLRRTQETQTDGRTDGRTRASRPPSSALPGQGLALSLPPAAVHRGTPEAGSVHRPLLLVLFGGPAPLQGAKPTDLPLPIPCGPCRSTRGPSQLSLRPNWRMEAHGGGRVFKFSASPRETFRGAEPRQTYIRRGHRGGVEERVGLGGGRSAHRHADPAASSGS